MMQLLEFVFRDLGHFIGTMILICLFGSFLCTIAAILRVHK
jgi:hypothetical protein